MKMMNQDVNWGCVNNGAYSCSPTSANRMKMAALAVYGSESCEFDALNLTLKETSKGLVLDSYTPRGRVGYNGIQNSFCNGKIINEFGKVLCDGDKNYNSKVFNAKELGYTQEMRDMGSCGGLEWAGVVKNYVTGVGLWTDLKPGALIGHESHSSIFVRYEIRKKLGLGMMVWDQSNVLRFVPMNESSVKGFDIINNNGVQRAANLK